MKGLLAIWHHLYHVKSPEKHPWMGVTFIKVAGPKINTPPWMTFTFLKFYKWFQVAKRITYFFIVNLFGEGVWATTCRIFR